MIDKLKLQSNRFVPHTNFIGYNLFPLKSPWKSDRLSITKTLMYTEYEIKLTKQDFHNDFKKVSCKYSNGINKHEYYAEDQFRKWRGEEIPRPKYFYFVTPKDLLDLSEIPDHCGLLELGSYKLRVKKKAPVLKSKKLSAGQFYNLATKVSRKRV